MEKDKSKVKPVEKPSKPAPEVDVDDEILEAADVPREVGGEEEEDAAFDEDVDDLLLGSTSAPPPPPPKIKIKAPRRPAPDLDDLDAAFYDAADASGAASRTEPAKTEDDDFILAEPLPKPKLKVSLGGPKRPAPAAAPPVPAPLAHPVLNIETPPSQPLKREVSVSHKASSGSPAPSASRKRAASVETPESASRLPVDVAKCKALLQKLSEVQYGWIFALPVDSTQPGLESYVLQPIRV